METYKDIQYSLSRSDRKTASIYIERDGQVSLIVPEQLSQQSVEEIIEKKRSWIYRGLAEWRDLNATAVKREFVGGEGFLYLGRSYRLKIVEEGHLPLVLKDGYFHLRLNNGTSPEIAFKEFYREKGQKHIPERVELYKKQLGVEPKDIRVMELAHRWASCSEKGNVNFHWKCMMAPLTIIDYIVVHELVHLIHKNHTEAFWNEVDKVLPDYRERKNRLKLNGAGMTV